MNKIKRGIILLLLIFVFSNLKTYASDINRIFGQNRYDTAVSFSQKNFQRSDSIILASGELFPDAICASQFARVIDAPILLTRKTEMPDSVLKEIDRLKPEIIYIIGGDETIEIKQVENLGIPYLRIAGKTRYQTSEKIVDEIINKGMSKEKIIVVSGEDFANIISANQLSLSLKYPILLINNEIPYKYKNSQIYQIGDIKAKINAFEKITGIDKYEISKKCLELSKDYKNLNIASGEKFPDALIAAAQGKNILLTKDNGLNTYAIDLLSTGNYENINIIGGDESISDSVIDQIFGINEQNIRNAELPEKLKKNHDGKIMVLMYHDIDDYNDRYHRTAGAFKADIINLYNKGYLPISLKEYYTNNINIEEGYTPYIITLDDGTESKIRLNSDGKLSGDCAFSILREMEQKLPGFKAKATFFVNYKIPFGQEEFAAKKINMIINAGMDIGNHTVNHVDLEKNPDLIEKEIALEKKYLEDYIESDYIVDTFSIPYSIVFDDLKKYERVREGEYEGIKYKNNLIVGGIPVPADSPEIFDSKRHILPRITAAREKVYGRGLYDYLEYFDKNPQERYVK